MIDQENRNVGVSPKFSGYSSLSADRVTSSGSAQMGVVLRQPAAGYPDIPEHPLDGPIPTD